MGKHIVNLILLELCKITIRWDLVSGFKACGLVHLNLVYAIQPLKVALVRRSLSAVCHYISSYYQLSGIITAEYTSQSRHSAV